MSKKKASKQVGKVNPEKYIREKSGKLPIYKCWINAEWEQSRLAEILIARKHANENLTVCVYFVDIACRGVINTLYLFNVPVDKMDQILKSQENLTDVSYELAHNIIFAALEYAEELGIYPNEKFTKTTSFFLAEDNDNIPLITVKCGGKDGKPLYVISEDDTEKYQKQMISHLEKKVGKGNFKYVRANKSTNQNVDDEYIRNTIAEINAMNENDQKKLFMELVAKNNTNKISSIEYIKLQTLTIKFDDFVPQEDITEELDILHRDLDHPVTSVFEFPDSLFAGIQTEDRQGIITLFWDIANSFFERKQMEQALEIFKKRLNQDVPLVHYFELLFMTINDITDYEKSEKYQLQYPDYFLIGLLRNMNLLYNKDISHDEKSVVLDKMRKLLSESQKPLSDYEYTLFMSIYLPHYIHEIDDKWKRLMRTIAINKYLDDSNDVITNMLYPIYKMLLKLKSSLLVLQMLNKLEIRN